MLKPGLFIGRQQTAAKGRRPGAEIEWTMKLPMLLKPPLKARILIVPVPSPLQSRSLEKFRLAGQLCGTAQAIKMPGPDGFHVPLLTSDQQRVPRVWCTASRSGQQQHHCRTQPARQLAPNRLNQSSIRLHASSAASLR
jgi:hypothetical protein